MAPRRGKSLVGSATEGLQIKSQEEEERVYFLCIWGELTEMK